MLLVLLIIFIVPFLIYSLFTLFTDVSTPEGVTPSQFLMIVLVSKVGVAIAFVLVFFLARNAFTGRWFLYAFIWWLMLAIGEIGQAIGPDYSWADAVAGIVSEAIYFPLSGYVVNRLVGNNK